MIKTCGICDLPYEAHSNNSKYCSDPCKAEAMRRQQSKYMKRRRSRGKFAPPPERKRDKSPVNTRFRCLEDKLPFDEGGFRPGAMFDGRELRTMVEAGNVAQGSKFWDTKERKTFVVKGFELVPARS